MNCTAVSHGDYLCYKTCQSRKLQRVPGRTNELRTLLRKKKFLSKKMWKVLSQMFSIWVISVRLIEKGLKSAGSGRCSRYRAREDSWGEFFSAQKLILLKSIFLVLIDEMQKRKIVFKKWRTSLLLVFKSTGITRRDPKLIQSILSRLGFKTFIGYRWKKDHRLSHRYLRLTPWNTLPRRCHSPLRTKVLVSPSPLSTKSNWNSKFIMMSCGTAASNLQPAMKSSYAYSCHCCGC